MASNIWVKPAYVAVQVQQGQAVLVLGQPQACQLGHEDASLALLSQERELAPQGLHFGQAVQAQQLPQLCRTVFLDVFGTLDAQQGQQYQAEHRGPQAIEGGADGSKHAAENLQAPMRL
jgi:hypothetical protein